MKLINKKILLLISLLIFPFTFIAAQDVDIVPYLKQIEAGNSANVKAELPELKRKNPESPSVLFLEGVLTENGQQAVVIYQKIVDEFPASKYADAALYRIYSYYYALGLYETAKEKLNLLRTNYPSSPYLKVASQNVVPEQNEKSEEPVEKDKQTVSEQKYQYTIQAGAFSNPENAKSLQTDFENAGIFSLIKEKNVAGTVFNIVYVGKFINENEADTFLKVINEKFNLNARIVPITW